MRRSHVEGRSVKYAAKQYVSDYEEPPKGTEMDDKKAPLERSKGTVKFFDCEKGFGFAKREGKPDVFIHANALKRSGIYDFVETGDVLEFDVIPVDGKGPKADAIKLLERAAKA